jgi:peptidoglycan/LPS O-acetylase OafA/YrhL
MSTPRPAFRADLEALRGVAVLLVVAYHAGVPALAGGFVGVDVFFVLSGYFLTRLLVREYAATGTVDVGAFYARRALRLLPALLVVVAATLAAVWALYAPIDRADVVATARSVVLGTANLAFAREAVDYFGRADSPFLHTWSLAVDQQVSLFGPLLFLALASLGGWSVARRRGDAARATDEASRRAAGLLRGVGIGLAVTGAVSLAAAVWLTRVAPPWAFFGTHARVWEFAVGGLLALALPADAAPATGSARSAGWLQGAGLLAIAVAALAYDPGMSYPGVAALLPVAGAAALVAGGALGGRLLAAERSIVRLLGWFGEVSYGWYLWHWPMIVTGAVLAPAIGVPGRLAWSVAALVPAWLTLRWIERPMRAGRGESAPPSAWRLAAVAAACLTIALGAAGLRRAAERRVAAPDQRALAAAREDRTAHECWAGRGATAPRDPASDVCVFGDPRGATTVALFGDSHAEHWLAALDRLGRERGWRVVLLVKGGCPVSDAPELIGGRHARRGRECAAYREAVVRQLIALRPAVAVLGSWDEYVSRDAAARGGRDAEDRVSPAAWERGLRRTYTRLGAAGVPVVAIRGTPFPGFDVPACLSRRADRRPLASPCVYERAAAVHVAARAAQAAAVRDAASRGLPVRAIDMTDQICPTATCGVVRHGRVAFTDDNHLTASFTRALAGVLGARLDAAVGPLVARRR